MYILIFTVTIVILFLLFCNNSAEHAENVGPSTNEAIQTLASMYNNNKLSASEIETTGNITSGGDVKIKGNLNVDGKINKINLGNKWILSGVGDGEADDDWLRLKGTNGKDYYGGFSANKIWANELITPQLSTNPKCELRRIGNYYNNHEFLDRFPVMCKDGEYLQGWRMVRSYDDQGHQPWEIRYKCCTLGQLSSGTPDRSGPSVPKKSSQF
jgi:hypothetical protein